MKHNEAAEALSRCNLLRKRRKSLFWRFVDLCTPTRKAPEK